MNWYKTSENSKTYDQYRDFFKKIASDWTEQKDVTGNLTFRFPWGTIFWHHDMKNEKRIGIDINSIGQTIGLYEAADMIGLKIIVEMEKGDDRYYYHKFIENSIENMEKLKQLALLGTGSQQRYQLMKDEEQTKYNEKMLNNFSYSEREKIEYLMWHYAVENYNFVNDGLIIFNLKNNDGEVKIFKSGEKYFWGANISAAAQYEYDNLEDLLFFLHGFFERSQQRSKKL